MVQIALPISDDIVGDWAPIGGPSTLFDAVDDGMSSDSEYAETTTLDALSELGLAAVTDPENNINHVLRVRMQGNGTGPPERLTAALFEGTTARATSGNFTSRGLWTTQTYVLTATEADSIVDYSALSLRLVCTNLGGGDTMWFSGAQFEVDDAPVGGDEPVLVAYRRPNPLLRM